MLVRRTVIGLLLLACGAAPVLIGASCPPPSSPIYTSLVTDNTILSLALPPCSQGFVCVNFTNNTTIPVDVAFYRHNGFDPNDLYAKTPSFSCCTNPNSQVACPCPCQGALQGECKLNREEIYRAVNLSTISGQQTLTLATNQSALERIRCGDVKTMGVAVAVDTGDVLNQPADRNEPVYRDEAGGVPCGQTVQFIIIDLNETTAGGGSAALVTLAIRTQFSR